MSCAQCGADIGYTPAEGVTVTCGRCVMGLCLGEQRRQEDKLARISAEEVVEKRKAKGWSQRMLAARLDVPITHLQEFERGLRLCPPKVADWIS